jgi:hypothetical protein
MVDNGVQYKASMTRKQWRETFVRCQMVPPAHRASSKWLEDACAETFEVAEVTINVAKGDMLTKEFEKGKAEDRVELTLSRSAVLGVKFASIQYIMGFSKQPAASMFMRATILDSLKEVGPNGTLMRMVIKESALPESPDLDENELDLEKKV